MKKIEIKRYINDNLIKLEDTVVDEIIVEIFLENMFIAKLITYPLAIKELVLGNLFNHGFIKSKDEISEFTSKKEKNKYLVNITLRKTDKEDGFKKLSNISTEKISSFIESSPKSILKSMNDFENLSNLFINTGAVHVAALAELNESNKEIRVIFHFEDIGRFNVVDKIIGKAVLDSIDLEGKILLFSGRIFEEIVNKISKTKIRFIFSRAAASLSAIKFANKENITLIGFCREKKFNIYN